MRHDGGRCRRHNGNVWSPRRASDLGRIGLKGERLKGVRNTPWRQAICGGIKASGAQTANESARRLPSTVEQVTRARCRSPPASAVKALPAVGRAAPCGGNIDSGLAGMTPGPAAGAKRIAFAAAGRAITRWRRKTGTGPRRPRQRLRGWRRRVRRPPPGWRPRLPWQPVAEAPRSPSIMWGPGGEARRGRALGPSGRVEGG